jgi:hypothetical protein
MGPPPIGRGSHCVVAKLGLIFLLWNFFSVGIIKSIFGVDMVKIGR